MKTKGLPWEKSKAFDGSAVVGNFVPTSEIEDLNNLSFQLFKNDSLAQNGNTKDMIFNIDEIITHISKYITLKIGDIIFTGTPGGVGRIQQDDVLKGKLMDRRSFEIKVK